MWNKPYSYKEGFIVGAALIVCGLALQWGVGPLEWAVFAAPVNYIILGVLISLIIGLYVLRNRFYAIRFLMTAKAAVPAMVFATLLTAVMGIVQQVPSTVAPADAIGLTRMLSFWPFILIYLWVTFIVGLVTVRGLHRFSIYRLPALVCHIGLFIALTTATLGSADMQRLKMILAVGQPECRVIDERRQIHDLSVTVELQRFILEEYSPTDLPEGMPPMPKRFASEVRISTKSGQVYQTTVEVNKPVRVGGYDLYQYGYDMEAGAASRISILELVRDPWLPAVYSGIYLLLAGAVLVFITAGNKRKEAKT